MKKIKHYALGLLGTVLLTAGIVACSSEEANTAQQETATTVWNKSGSTFTGGLVAKVVNGKATLIHSEADIKASLISKGIFKQVESVELAYGIDPQTKLQEAFVMVVGIETTSSQSLAFIADLTVNGNQLIISNPDTNQQAFSTFSCRGNNCSHCDFLRTGLFRRISGCRACNKAVEEGRPATCETEINGGGTVIKPVSQTLVSPF